jgi:hypothetical protein
MAADLTQTENAFDTKTEALLADLSRVAENRSRLNRWSRPLIWTGLYYEVGYGLLVKLLHLPVPTSYAAILEQFMNIAMWVVGIAMMPEYLFWKRVEKDRARIERLVRELSTDSRAVGALAQLCGATQVLSVVDIALGPLLKLLPDVKAGDARYISESQMEALLALLPVRIQVGPVARCAELRLAILKALEQIGDSRAIEPVRRLTTGRSNACRQAAQECLAVLEQHGEERDHHRFLLLPASVETGKETLLRATVPQVETQPELLLRVAPEEGRG